MTNTLTTDLTTPHIESDQVVSQPFQDVTPQTNFNINEEQQSLNIPPIPSTGISSKTMKNDTHEQHNSLTPQILSNTEEILQTVHIGA